MGGKMEEWALLDVLNVVWWQNEINTILMGGVLVLGFEEEGALCLVWTTQIIKSSWSSCL